MAVTEAEVEAEAVAEAEAHVASKADATEADQNHLFFLSGYLFRFLSPFLCYVMKKISVDNIDEKKEKEKETRTDTHQQMRLHTNRCGYTPTDAATFGWGAAEGAACLF